MSFLSCRILPAVNEHVTSATFLCVYQLMRLRSDKLSRGKMLSTLVSIFRQEKDPADDFADSSLFLLCFM